MAGYRYEAVDGVGRSTRGVLEADSLRLARAKLRAQGLLPVEVAPLHTPSRSRLPGGWPLRAVSEQERALITRQLATLLQAGLPVTQALDACIEQTEAQRARQVLASIRGDVLAGAPLSAAMSRHSASFDELYRTLVAAGEETGRLAEVLGRLADHLERADALRRRVGAALIYPALLTVVALFIVTGLLTYVVPQVVSVFEQTHQRLPWLTVALIEVSTAVQAYGAGVGLLTVIAAGLGWRLLRRPAYRRRWHALLLRLPVLGRLLRSLQTARTARTLAILVGSGVPLLRALQAARGVITLLPMRQALEQVAERVREGGSLSRAIAATGLFPPVLAHLAASGEHSGRLAEMLERVADIQSRELDARVQTFTALLEPLLILFMGAVVLVIVLAILLPVFEMNQLLR
jgi:general secretion pathway protein F